ncbi:hypothetical protein BDY24DRAFT_336828 [Mrakia frigida]|uniref:tRNA-dihydrouridine(20) synthase (NAD(+)) n=1 Tax=Mrakia frigida TaxID=29902 RepID=UPI003FCC1E98
MPVSEHTLSPPQSPAPPAKKQKLDESASSTSSSLPPPPPPPSLVVDEQPVASTSTLPEEVVVAAPTRAKTTVDYRNKAVLAPMVRSGNLPNRLLSLEYGADLVWGPEMVDKAMIGCKRVVNERTGIIDYVRTFTPIFWTHPVEKPHLIFQLGSSTPSLAVEAALLVQDDVAGIDLNCGCPKPFSTHSGMGAALLSTPDLLCDILRALVGALYVPVSCKIRLLKTQEETLELVEKICSTGISCLTVHARTREMRSSEAALMGRLREVVKVADRFGIPVVANGDVGGMWDFEKIKEMTGVSSIMIARAAERNPSCFLPDKALDTTTVVIPRLLRLTNHFSNPFSNTKFLLTQLHPTPNLSPYSKAESKPLHASIVPSTSFFSWCQTFNVDLGGATEEQAGKDGYVIPGETTEEVLRPMLEGIERRKQAREAGGWALGGEREKRVVEEEGEVAGLKKLEEERKEEVEELREEAEGEDGWRVQLMEEEEAMNDEEAEAVNETPGAAVTSAAVV